MKKLVVTILGISVLGIFGSASVSGAPAAIKPPQAPNPTLAAETVDDISVPLDVLLYAQTEYQGFAVTHADKVTRDGKQAYRLRVDRSDAANYGDSFYLLYDMNWKLLGEEKIAHPLQKTETAKPEQKQQSDQPKEEQKKPEPGTTNVKPEQTPVDTPTTTQPTQPTTTTGNTGTTDTTQPAPTTTTGDSQTTTTTTDGGTTTN